MFNLGNFIFMIIKSKYYELKEVHEFNKFIKSLSIDELRSSAFQNIEYLLVNCLSFNKSYKDISKFVPNSPTWLEITEQNKKYDDAQKTLEEYKHTKEMVLEEYYPTSLNIWKHTYSTNLNFFEDTETYEETFHFYTVGTFNEHILIVDNRIQPEKKQIKWDSLYLDYINRECSDNKDLIEEACDIIDLQNRIISAYDLTERLTKQYGERITYDDLYNIFCVSNTIFYRQGSRSFIKYNEKEYFDIDIFNLVKEYWKYKDKKYIQDDEYIEYPRHVRYVDFKEKLNNGEYTLVEEIKPEEDLPF